MCNKAVNINRPPELFGLFVEMEKMQKYSLKSLRLKKQLNW